METVHKTTAAATRAGLEFVLSDDSVDRVGDVISQDGWQLDNFLKNPVALYAHNPDMPVGRWTDVRVEAGRLLGRLKLATKGTSSRIDEIIALIQQGILRAVSVGFRPIEREPMPGDGNGIRFTKSELLEASVVAVPANANALALAKSLHISAETMRLVFGEQADPTAAPTRTKAGEQAASNANRKGNPMKPLSQRIEDAQADLTRDRDGLADALSNDEPDLVDEFTLKVEAGEETLARLKRAETALVARDASLPAGRRGDASPPLRRPFGVTREVTPMDLWVRRAVVHIERAMTNKAVEEILDKRYPDRDAATDAVVKAAVPGATTTMAGWAAELVHEANGAFLESLRAISIYPTIAGKGTRLTFGPNAGTIRIPSRAATPSISGSFVGEAAPIPVRRLGLTSIPLSPHKMGVLSVWSREIGMYSTPALESLVRQEILADTADTIDALMLDATAGSAVRPAGLLYNVAGLTPTAGGGYAAMIGDFQKLMAPFDAAKAGRDMVFIMNPEQKRALSWTPGPDGTLGWTTALTESVTIIASTNCPADKVIAIDAADFASADGDSPEFEVSETAVLHMEDTTPLDISAPGAPNPTVAAPVQSMFQTAQLAIRMLLDITWAMRRTGMVQFINGVTW